MSPRDFAVFGALLAALSAAFAALSGAAAWIAWLNLSDVGAHPSFLVGGLASLACSALLLRWSAEGFRGALRFARQAVERRREDLVREVLES